MTFFPYALLPTFSVMKQMRHYLQHSLSSFLACFRFVLKVKAKHFLVLCNFHSSCSWRGVSFLMNCCAMQSTKNHFHLKHFWEKSRGKFAENKMSHRKSTVDKVWKFCRMLGQELESQTRTDAILGSVNILLALCWASKVQDPDIYL